MALPSTPEAGGGGYTFERDLFEGLLRRIAFSRHEFVLLGDEQGWSRSLPPNARYAPGTTARVAPAPRAWLRAQRLRASLRRRLERSHGADAQTTTVPSNPHGLQFLIHFRPWVTHCDIPYLVFVWDLEHRRQPYFPEVSSGGEWQAREQMFSTSLPRASVIVTGTEAGRRQIEMFYRVLPERVLVSPLPTPGDALDLAAAIGESSGREIDGPPTLLYPAQFWAHKNHVGLLKALKCLGDRHGIHPTLLLAGSDQGNRTHIETCAHTLGLASQVRFLGFVPRDQLLRLYTEVTALVYPSTFGPDNLPPLEAFALGCPVVASRLAGAEEQLGEAAVLFDPHDHAEMAARIFAVLHDEGLRASLVARGRSRAQRWTSSDVADGILRWLDGFETVRSLWP